MATAKRTVRHPDELNIEDDVEEVELAAEPAKALSARPIDIPERNSTFASRAKVGKRIAVAENKAVKAAESK